MRFAFVLILFLLFFCSCATWKYQPLREYRMSKAYSFEKKNTKELFLDTIQISELLVATGVLKNSKIVDSIHFDPIVLQTMIQKNLSHINNRRVVLSETIQQSKSEKFAFYNDWGTKLDMLEASKLQSDKIRLLPYIEFSVRTAKERDGGGGISMAYETGQRIHSVLIGVILSIIHNDQTLISTSYYYSDMFENSVDSVTVYDFPYEKIDSLMALCVSDLNDAIVD